MNTELPHLPHQILEKAVKLRNAVRTIYITTYLCGRPVTASELAEKVGHARAYVNMRLNQLEDMGLIKSHTKGRTKFFEVKFVEE